MEKLQLKMKMLNVAMTEENWKSYDFIIKFWQKMNVKDESAMAGGILSAGIGIVITDFIKITARDPEMLDKLKGVKIDKGGVNEMIDVTI